MELADFALDKFETRMVSTVDAMQRKFASLQVGSLDSQSLDTVMVSAYGDEQPLKSVAQVSVRNATTLMVNTHDPSLLKALAKSIQDCGMDASAQVVNDKSLQVTFPKPSREGREAFAKRAKQQSELAKKGIRQARQDALNALKKKKSAAGEEVGRALQDDVEALAKFYVAVIEQRCDDKTDELLTI
jgi:ribosome recycling factor